MDNDDSLLTTLFRKLNVRSASLLIALTIAVAGCLMIYQGLRDDGEIDLKTPFVSGKVRTGFAGVLLVFMSTTLTIVIVQKSGNGPKQSIKVRRGDTSLEWEGILYYWKESRNIIDMLESISNKTFGKESLEEKDNTPTKSA